MRLSLGCSISSQDISQLNCCQVRVSNDHSVCHRKGTMPIVSDPYGVCLSRKGSVPLGIRSTASVMESSNTPLCKDLASWSRTEEGLPLFKEKWIYWINASGKTCVLKVILLVLELLNNEPINHIETRDILGDSKEVKLNSYFFSRKTKEVCRLETIITAEKSKLEGITYRITSETLWTKSTDEVSVRR